ncbi:MAG: AmmeMemoRadiSam system radical SAM enzyme [Lachnospiraceae bacterium]|nr:AmmeMemoRadiSam system radical SAM enzyme [Lachnospiraceae bacterium]
MNKAVCPVCFHHCSLKEDEYGLCRARKNSGGTVVCANYGKVTALALDPIEKKPLKRFFPGSMILSAGSFGCNLNCPFCQNHTIAAAGGNGFKAYREILPQEICEAAVRAKSRGNIGVAYTYNEAVVGYEFVRDTAKAVHEAGLKNVIVTNGTAELWVLEELLPYINAMNIDLKSFRPEGYRQLAGDLETVLKFITRAAEDCHVELTTLIVPGLSDSAEEMEHEAKWIADLDPEIPLHITRYFPMRHMTAPPTDIGCMKELEETARKYLKYVYLGNI